MRSRRSAGESAPRLPRHPGRCTPRYFGLRALLIEARGAARPPSARAPLRPRPRSDRRPRVTAAKFRGGMGPRPGRCASPPRPRFQSFRSSSAPFPARPEPLGGSGGRPPPPCPPHPALRTLPGAEKRRQSRRGVGCGAAVAAEPALGTLCEGRGPPGDSNSQRWARRRGLESGTRKLNVRIECRNQTCKKCRTKGNSPRPR